MHLEQWRDSCTSPNSNAEPPGLRKIKGPLSHGNRVFSLIFLTVDTNLDLPPPPHITSPTPRYHSAVTKRGRNRQHNKKEDIPHGCIK